MLQEAGQAAREANIRNFREHASEDRRVPGLPSTLNKRYAEWSGWDDFPGLNDGG